MPILTCRICKVPKPMVSMRKNRLGIYMDVCTDCSPTAVPRQNPKKLAKERRKKLNKSLHASTRLRAYAEQLKHRMTPAEKVLWDRLQERSGWHSQMCVAGYIPDFFNPHIPMVIEVDGSIHDTPTKRKKDETKDWKFRRLFGITVLRFRNEQVLYDVESVLREIDSRITSSPIAK